MRQAFYQDRDLLHEIAEAEGVRVAVITPWMLKNEKLGEIISSSKTRAQIRWFLIDEVHLANEHDPSVWQEPYRSITHMRARLPSRTIWAASELYLSFSRVLLVYLFTRACILRAQMHRGESPGSGMTLLTHIMYFPGLRILAITFRGHF